VSRFPLTRALQIPPVNVQMSLAAMLMCTDHAAFENPVISLKGVDVDLLAGAVGPNCRNAGKLDHRAKAGSRQTRKQPLRFGIGDRRERV
jgi:hypothetical protein